MIKIFRGEEGAKTNPSQVLTCKRSLTGLHKVVVEISGIAPQINRAHYIDRYALGKLPSEKA